MDHRVEIFIVFLALFIFGVGFNYWVAWLHLQDWSRGYVALLVVIGVIITLAGFAVLVGMETALWCGLCFVASGTPMIVGDVKRHLDERKKEQDALMELVRDTNAN